MQYSFSEHAIGVLLEREIQISWVELAMDHPERIAQLPDGTTHYLRRVEAFGNRWLRVVVNPNISPARVVTLFFDRRMK